MYDVARRAGVSIATVSRALNDEARIAASTRQRVLHIAAQLGYQPNDVARSLVGKATRTVAVLLPDICNPFFPELVTGIQTTADERGHVVLLCPNADDESKVIADLATLRRRQVDGVILVPGNLKTGNSKTGNLRDAVAGLPTVVVDRDINLPGPLVTVDHKAGARVAVEHLISLGHKVIAHIDGPRGISVARDRRTGWRDALRLAGLDQDLVYHGDFLEEGGYAAANRIRTERPDVTAIFAANDLSAIGALSACADTGVDVPSDVSVIGFDGIHLASYTTPKLTTIAQPIRQLGQEAARLLFDAPKSRDTVTLDTHIRVADSTGPAREAT